MVATELGRLFEVGFNAGVLTYIQQNQDKIEHKFGDLYRQDLRQLCFSQMVEMIWHQEDVTSLRDRETVKKWLTFFVQKGFLAGLNFFQEYVGYLGKNQSSKQKLEILYYQCNFYNENSLQTAPKEDIEIFRTQLSQFGDPTLTIGKYTETGEFLRADTLTLLRYGKKTRILSVDLSVFSIRSIQQMIDADEIRTLQRSLRREVNRLKSRSVFAGLCIDTESLDFAFSEDLAPYFTAFKKDDKESTKLIQAASYAYSFYHFLLEKGILNAQEPVGFNVVGYTDRGVSTISLDKEKLAVLQICSQIYKRQPTDQDILAARREVLAVIQRNAAKSFEDGKNFVTSLLAVSTMGDEIRPVIHHERIKDYLSLTDQVPSEVQEQVGLYGTTNLRQAHEELIKRVLSGPETYLFLTGHPGIGKTTAVVEFLKSKVNEGFLFFYASPRKQVNLDILTKFSIKGTDLLFDDQLLAINSSAEIINGNNGNYAVEYTSNTLHDLPEHPVRFIDAHAAPVGTGKRSPRLERSKEDVIEDAGQRTRGVLDSLCEALYTIIDRQLSTAVVATVSIQSLKKTASGNTLMHLQKIFQGAYNKKTDEVLPAKMHAIAERIKHIVIMVDEVTGDESGVDFLNGIHAFLHQYGLIDSPYGFCTKVIVADASIVDKRVIEQHLSQTSVEPDKIFFRQVKDADAPLPLSSEEFFFKGQRAVIVNANSYPARSLNISYKIFIEPVEFREDALLKSKVILRIQEEMVNDILAFLDQAPSDQVIVYIQDKDRLADLIEKIKAQRGEGFFQHPKDYLAIHASISEREKRNIADHQNSARVIFMTASASRGLSFPRTRLILVDLPRFEVEQNLMEIIQVIYRGRGQDEFGISLEQEEKQLILYVSDQAVYDGDDKERELSLQESILGILNVLLILKTSIMTRVRGFGRIGWKDFVMIPIGGKSILAAGDTFSGRMVTLIKALRRAHKLHRGDKRLESVYNGLERLLGRADIMLKRPASGKWTTNLPATYLSLRDFFNTKFVEVIDKSFEGLLDLGRIEPAYIAGSLLIVPLAERSLQENYHMQLGHELKVCENGELLNNMIALMKDSDYPQDLQNAIRQALELLNKLEHVTKSQMFQQGSYNTDQYYAIPLFTFMSGEAMKKYFDDQREEERKDVSFRDILASYMNSLYPVDTVLPIGSSYGEFPFIVFRSYGLGEVRSKMFADKYLLTSNELNVLNLILSH